jgi:hypothetical protein
MEIIIDKKTYTIKKIDIDLSEFDEDGLCEKYKNKSFVIIEDGQEPRVRMFNHVSDEENYRNAFDPLNHSEFIQVILNHGDECYTDELYEIISHNNIYGEIYYDYLKENHTHEDLKIK